MVEQGTYSTGLLLLLLSAVIFQSARIEKYIRRVAALKRWLKVLAIDDNEDVKQYEQNTRKASSKETIAQHLPRSWWLDEKNFQLERRAIFSKRWLFVTHTSIFQKPGDYHRFEVAGFSILLILGKDKQVRAFHNVCRHRAYAITKKTSGSSTVLGCRYHGWAYDTKGKLIKAPEFDKVPGFDKSLNGLWEVSSETRHGMVFINLDAGVPMKFLWKGSIPKWASELQHLENWQEEGKFNWKFAVIGSSTPGRKQKVTWNWTQLTSYLLNKGQDDLMIEPNSIIRIQPSYFLTMRFMPDSAKSTMVQCSLYTRGKHELNPVDIENVKLDVQHEVRRYELGQRRVLLGELPDLNELQIDLDQLLEEHRELERRSKTEVNPAARKHDTTKMGQDDDDFCRDLETKSTFCSASSSGLLDW